MEWILASASPRRKELLAEIIQTFTIEPSNADEELPQGISPKKAVALLSARKAREVAFRDGNEGKIVVGSDTVVAFGGEILGKPKDEEEAAAMLRALSGKKHAVYTGVTFAIRSGAAYRAVTRVCKTAVYFERLSENFIREYVASGSPMDKAGAYGIQDGGLVRKIRGSYTNVVGLPVELCKKMRKKIERRGGRTSNLDGKEEEW